MFEYSLSHMFEYNYLLSSWKRLCPIPCFFVSLQQLHLRVETTAGIPTVASLLWHPMLLGILIWVKHVRNK